MSPTRWTILGVAVIIGFILAMNLAIGKARAHSFFDQWCCSGQDCAAAPSKSVTWTPAGWSVTTPNINEVVPFDDEHIRYNPPGEPQFFICEYPKKHLRCLYVPEPEG